MHNQAKKRAGGDHTYRYSTTVRQTDTRPLNDPDRSAQDPHYSTGRWNPRLPDLYMPAMPPLKLIAAIKRRWLARCKRHRIHQLLAYGDHMLADLGLRREDLSWALQQPPTMDAANAVSRADHTRSSDRRYRQAM